MPPQRGLCGGGTHARLDAPGSLPLRLRGGPDALPVDESGARVDDAPSLAVVQGGHVLPRSYPQCSAT
eukprot:6687783-Lingulodinium_polyedra.AAC.1